MGYSKLHSSIVTSSLWTQPDHVRLLFITLLALCDKDGCVYGSRSGLERAAMIDPDASDEINPWTVLLSPDPESCDAMRAPENEGRRIELIPGGFRLLNFAYYRGLRNDDDRAEQNRQAQARHRAKSAKVSQSKPPSDAVSLGKPQSANTEAEAEAEADAEKTIRTTACPAGAGRVVAKPIGAVGEVIEHYLRFHPTSKPGEKERRLIEARLKEGFTVADLCGAIDGQHRSPYHLGQNEKGTKYLGLELAMRDSAKVNGFMAVKDAPTSSSEQVASVAARVLERMGGPNGHADGK